MLAGRPSAEGGCEQSQLKSQLFDHLVGTSSMERIKWVPIRVGYQFGMTARSTIGVTVKPPAPNGRS